MGEDQEPRSLVQVARRYSGLALLICAALAVAYFGKYLIRDGRQAALGNSVALEFHLELNECLLGEDVFADVTLRNISDTAIEVGYIVLPQFGLFISDQHGYEFGDRDCLDAIPSVTLSPGDSLTTSLPLMTCFGFLIDDSTNFNFPPVSQHWLRANYLHVIYSDSLPLRIVRPIGDDMEALLMLKRSFAAARAGKSGLWLQVLDSTIQRYSKSRYSHVAYRYATLAAYSVADTLLRVHYSKGAVRVAPDSPIAVSGLDDVTRLERRELAMSFCDSIVSAFPNTRVGFRALKILDSLRSLGNRP